MDRSATLTPVGTATANKQLVDHAIFTSIRSPMGEGYRIIAGSAGIRPEERMEVTRRAPSHGGLISENEDAIGIIGFPLPTGRYCVGYVRHAGKEHTSRGGLRVHTHFVILNREQFARFVCDPWLVAGTIAAIDGDEPILKTPPNLSMLDLGEGSKQLPDASPMMPAIEVAWYSSIVRETIGESILIANGTTLSENCEHLAWRLLPRVLREKRSMSIGIVFSPARSVDIYFATDRLDETRRAAAPSKALWVDPSESLPGTQPSEGQTPASKSKASAYAPWFALVDDLLANGRSPELLRICDLIDADATADGLKMTANLYEHLDRIYTATLEEVDCLTNRYAGCATSCSAQKMLLERFRKAADVRAAELNAERGERE